MTTITVSMPHLADGRTLSQNRDVAWLRRGQVISQTGDGLSTMAPLRPPKNLVARVFGAFNSGVRPWAVIGITLYGWIADSFHAGASLFGALHLVSATVTPTLIAGCQRLARTPTTRHGRSR